ncbi:MAG: hypothetical protein WAM77_28170 [Xanthobacteraceae bacterium]|jgi:hypothetical protein
MDDSGICVELHFKNRLSLIEAYDRYGFYSYHLAEQHGTPLGLVGTACRTSHRLRRCWQLHVNRVKGSGEAVHPLPLCGQEMRGVRT